MGRGKRTPATPKSIEAIRHEEATRRNIPSAEQRSFVSKEMAGPVEWRAARNRDLDPQLVWRGKDQQDWSDLVVQAPPLYIQEKVHPKALIDDLRRSGEWRVKSGENSTTSHSPLSTQLNLFSDFNGIPEGADKTEFYQHDANWTNRMILGDSLQVMASLAEREGLRGKVQCIYLDPPYGIKFNSNFQWSTTSRDVKDGNREHISREPEQVKAFRDTWRDGIHSYLTYLRDRLTVARDLLTDSGSIFVQIGDENVHRVRALMDEVFGQDNYCGQIVFSKTSGQTSGLLSSTFDYLLWFTRDKEKTKFRQLFDARSQFENATERYVFCETPSGQMIDLSIAQKQGKEPIPSGRILKLVDTTSQTGSETSRQEFHFQGNVFRPPGSRGWSSHPAGLSRVGIAGYLHKQGKHIWWKSYRDDVSYRAKNLNWRDTVSNAFGDERIYVVQTNNTAIQHCVLMTTDAGDLVLDPTCGSGTTATVAEQWGRRWITIDTSRVALALARARIMGARYPYYLLADSPEGRAKERELRRVKSEEWQVESGLSDSHHSSRHSIRQGFVYERVPHITLKSIANNAEIDVIWEEYEQRLRPLREELSVASGESQTLEEWQIPREAPANWPLSTSPLFTAFWRERIERQKAIDASIAAKADSEFLYDRPYSDNKKVRVAGPFTVESLSPHRTLGVDENDELIDSMAETGDTYGKPQDFASMILMELGISGVQQAHKEDKIAFTSLVPWPGEYICAEGVFEVESDEWLVASNPPPLTTSHSPLTTRRAAVFIGPEFGTVSRPDLVTAAREAADSGFDVLIACAFNYDAHSTEFNKLGRIPVLKARMNADLHMAADLKNTGKGNLFVIFGEPDIDLLNAPNGQVRVKVNGVDVFHPNTGEVRSDGPEGIACWFIDTDYDQESFFVRHAYFLGANDPYKSLKTTLKAEIDEEAWSSLHSDTSRPFDRPASGRIAVKVINHLGDEVMKVFRV